MFIVSFSTVFFETWVPMTLASSTECVGIIAGVLLSILWLKEKFFPRYDIPSIVLIVLGNAGLILLAKIPDDDYTLNELK